MKLEVIEKTETKWVFSVEGISIEMANALRRIMMSEIPVMAIDEVIILKNDSPLYDEIISHRLGLIPLKTDLEAYKLPKDCDCGGFGCPQCQVSLTCEITNETNAPLMIYSGDLQSNDPVIVPVDPYIPLVKIYKNDKVIIEAYAILGIGKNHMKWQPVSTIFYRFRPIVTFDSTKCSKCSDKCIVSRMCSKKLFNFTNKKAPVLQEDYWKTCNLCRSCKDNCPEKGIEVSYKDKSYIYNIESDGVLPFDVVIKKTFEIFLAKIAEFVEKLEEIEISE